MHCNLGKCAIDSKLDSSFTSLKGKCAANELSLNTENICDLYFSYTHNKNVLDVQNINLKFLGLLVLLDYVLKH